jgi:hypothetical protein
MITTTIIIAFAVLAVLVLVRAVVRQHRPVPDLQALEQYTRPVDLAAFRNLIDPVEEDYLRESLPAGPFRAIQRKRLRAALEYVQRAAYNADILSRVGEAARRSSNPEMAVAAGELVNNAVRLRINAKLVTVVLYARMLMPGARLSVGRITDAYENLTQGVARLVRLRNPAQAGRVVAAI